MLGYFIYYIYNLDLYMVPEVYDFWGWESWLVHLESATYLQAFSLCFTLLLLLFPLLEKSSFFYSIFNLFTAHNIDTKFIPIQLVLRVSTAYCFIAPMFGMSTFRLSSTTLFFAILWHGFIAIALLIWLLNPVQD